MEIALLTIYAQSIIMFPINNKNGLTPMESIEINQLSPAQRRELAQKVGKSPVYLWQIGDGIRTPSLETADRLMDHEPRLTVKSLLAPKRRRDAI